MESKNLGNNIMGIADLLRLERNGKTVPLSRFYTDFKKDSSKVCYGFVEGKDDPSYYRTTIKQKIDKDCSVILYPSDGKEVLKYVYEEIRNRKYPIEKIVYFMDRDLSCIINDTNIINDPYVYITDNYSIENDILNEDTLESVLQDILGFCSTPTDELSSIKNLYNQQLNDFDNRMLPIMANIIVWKQNNIKPANYKNLKIRQLFNVKNGILTQIGSQDEIIKKLYKDSQVDYSMYDKSKMEIVMSELKEKSLVHQIVRGKYFAVFFILFCNSIHNDCSTMHINKTNKGRTLNENDIMETIAPRARVPKSLETFMEKTILQYFNNIAHD